MERKTPLELLSAQIRKRQHRGGEHSVLVFQVWGHHHVVPFASEVAEVRSEDGSPVRLNKVQSGTTIDDLTLEGRLTLQAYDSDLGWWVPLVQGRIKEGHWCEGKDDGTG